MDKGSKFFYTKTIKFYKNLNDYISDYTGFNNLELDNFSSLFIVYFGILIFIFICFFFIQMFPFYYRKWTDYYYEHFYLH